MSDVTTAAGLAGFLLARYDEHIARCWERAVAPGSAFVRQLSLHCIGGSDSGGSKAAQP